MIDQPEFHFDVSTTEIEAGISRGDYPWLCEHVFTPALVQFLDKKRTDVLINNPRPRARRQAGTRRHRTRRLREFRP
jgi:hypothetical protein